MPEDNSLVRDEDQDDTPSVRQLLHAATGDRDAEAEGTRGPVSRRRQRGRREDRGRAGARRHPGRAEARARRRHPRGRRGSRRDTTRRARVAGYSPGPATTSSSPPNIARFLRNWIRCIVLGLRILLGPEAVTGERRRHERAGERRRREPRAGSRARASRPPPTCTAPLSRTSCSVSASRPSVPMTLLGHHGCLAGLAGRLASRHPSPPTTNIGASRADGMRRVSFMMSASTRRVREPKRLTRRPRTTRTLPWSSTRRAPAPRERDRRSASPCPPRVERLGRRVGPSSSSGRVAVAHLDVDAPGRDVHAHREVRRRVDDRVGRELTDEQPRFVEDARHARRRSACP